MTTISNKATAIPCQRECNIVQPRARISSSDKSRGIGFIVMEIVERIKLLKNSVLASFQVLDDFLYLLEVLNTSLIVTQSPNQQL